MSNHDRFKRKLAAFFHDPIDKPFTLMQTGERHEISAKDLRDRAGVSIGEFDNAADHVASAMERSFLPKDDKQLRIRFLERPAIIHPFAGQLLTGASEITSLKLPEIKEITNNAIESLNLGQYSPREAWFCLWRNVIPALENYSDEILSQYWAVAPADTRIPDHAIFQHLKVTALFSNSTYEEKQFLNNSSFVIFTIGPVQSFIHQSRKTKDLFWSSYLLSYLTWIGIKEIILRYGPDAIVFPDLHGQPLVDQWLEETFDFEVLQSRATGKSRNIPTLPNRFFAIIEENQKKELQQLLRDIEHTVRNEFSDIGDEILDNMKIEPQPELHDRFKAHLKDSLQIYWAGAPLQLDAEANLTPRHIVTSVQKFFSDEEVNRIYSILDFAENGDMVKYHDPNIGHIYNIFYSFTEKLLAVQKNARKFHQLNEVGRKCSLCGERNVLFYQGSPALINKTKPAPVKIAMESRVHLAENEGLCGICFVKRFANRAGRFLDIKPGFDSTASVASIHLLQEHEQEINEYVQQFKELTGLMHFDDELLYEENLTTDYFRKNLLSSDELREEDIRKKVKETRKRWKKTFGNRSNSKTNLKLTSYYAVIALDGDNMGKWISGEMAPRFDQVYHPDVWRKLPEQFKAELKKMGKKDPGEEYGKRPMTPALHSALSRALCDYSLEFVHRIVEKDYRGKLIYTGGDDVLALVNLHALFDVLLELRAAFSGHLFDNGYVNFNDETVSGFVRRNSRIFTTLGPEATASTGVAIAHYKTPLTEVLDRAYGMERKAKKAPEKDAFALGLMKRSGEHKECILKYRDFNIVHPDGSIGILKNLINGMGQFDVSKKFIFTLRREFDPMIDPGTGKARNVHEKMLQSEIQRLLFRAMEGEAKGDKERKWVEETSYDIVNLYFANGLKLNNLLNTLEIVTFLLREVKKP